MVEPTYRTLEILTQLAILASGTRISYRGVENIPARGGAVVTINHTSYVDWSPAAVHDQGRDGTGKGGQRPDQAHGHHSGGPKRRGGRICGGRAAVTGGGVGGRLSGGHHQPQLRAERVQDRGRPHGNRSGRPDRPGDRLGGTSDLDQGSPPVFVAQQGADHRAG